TRWGCSRGSAAGRRSTPRSSCSGRTSRPARCSSARRTRKRSRSWCRGRGEGEPGASATGVRFLQSPTLPARPAVLLLLALDLGHLGGVEGVLDELQRLPGVVDLVVALGRHG